MKNRSLVQTFEPFVRPLSPESRIQSETRFAELPIVVASTGGSAPVVGSQQGVRRIIRTMASPRKSPAVIQQQRFKATCTCQVSRRPGSSHCKPTHVMYAPPPPLAYLVYRAPLRQWSEMGMPLPMLVSVTQARLVPRTWHSSWEQADSLVGINDMETWQPARRWCDHRDRARVRVAWTCYLPEHVAGLKISVVITPTVRALSSNVPAAPLLKRSV